MRTLFAIALLLAPASALPTPPPAAANPVDSAAGSPAAGKMAQAFAAARAKSAPPSPKKVAKQEAGLLASAKRFFASFSKAKSTPNPNVSHNFSNMRSFAAEFKKMTSWWCSQEGHGAERMCMVQAGKKVTKETGGKSTQIAEIRKQYCAANKEAMMCTNNLMGSMMGMGGRGPGAMMGLPHSG